MKSINLALVTMLLLLHVKSLPEWAEKTLATLSTDEKIGQLFMVSARADSSLMAQDKVVSNNHIATSNHMHQDYVVHLITDYYVGGVIYLGTHTVWEQQALTHRFQSRANIPLLIGQDFEWGLSMRLTDCPPFPRAMTLSAAGRPDLAYKMGYTIGNQCRALGVHINFAPVVDINTNPNNPIIGTRSFGDTAQRVIEYAAPYIQGMLDVGIIPCIKHFPGHGDTHVDSHCSLPTITHSKKYLEQTELMPFKTLIQHGIPAIMSAHLSVPSLDATETPATLSHAIITDLLRNTYNFDGLIITDALDMAALTNAVKPAQVALQALLAGNDILLAPSDVPGACTLIKNALLDGMLSTSELDEHVLRILRAKEWIFQTHSHSPVAPITTAEDLYPPQTMHLQQELYNAACTVLYNHSHAIPLAKKNSKPWHVTAIGNGDPTSFLQTLDAQGITAQYHVIENALAECKNTAVIIALYGTPGYAQTIPVNAIDQIKTLKQANQTCVVVLFGSPYLASSLPKTDALLLAYEDNTPAQQAAAYVLTGVIRPQGVAPIQI